MSNIDAIRKKYEAELAKAAAQDEVLRLIAGMLPEDVKPDMVFIYDYPLMPTAIRFTAKDFCAIEKVRNAFRDFMVPFDYFRDVDNHSRALPPEVYEGKVGVKMISPAGAGCTGAIIDVQNGKGFQSKSISWFIKAGEQMLEVRVEPESLSNGSAWGYQFGVQSKRSYTNQGDLSFAEHKLGPELLGLASETICYGGSHDETGHFRVYVHDGDALDRFIEQKAEEEFAYERRRHDREASEFKNGDGPARARNKAHLIHGVLLSLPEFNGENLTLDAVQALGYENLSRSIYEDLPEVTRAGIHDVVNSLYFLTKNSDGYDSAWCYRDALRSEFSKLCDERQAKPSIRSPRAGM